MYDKFDYSMIPQHTRDALRRWVFTACPPGGFLTAMLSNDLMGAVGKADGENIKCIPQIAMFIYNRVPANCQGSVERMGKWREELERIKRKGWSFTFGPFEADAEPEHFQND